MSEYNIFFVDRTTHPYPIDNGGIAVFCQKVGQEKEARVIWTLPRHLATPQVLEAIQSAFSRGLDAMREEMVDTLQAYSYLVPIGKTTDGSKFGQIHGQEGV
jgi:hypothetical protein